MSSNDRSVSINRKALTFEERCVHLLAFKDEFGHCNVPRKFANNPSLGQRCNDVGVTTLEEHTRKSKRE